MSTHSFLGNVFRLLGIIEVERSENGEVREFMPHKRYKNANTVPLHRFGSGPFCKFRMAKGLKTPGIYILTINDEPMYVGECENADKRWGSNGYGNISPRNPFVGGQSTNCRINMNILEQAKACKLCELWFFDFNGTKSERLELETSLIEGLRPNWNLAKNASKSFAR